MAHGGQGAVRLPFQEVRHIHAYRKNRVREGDFPGSSRSPLMNKSVPYLMMNNSVQSFGFKLLGDRSSSVDDRSSRVCGRYRTAYRPVRRLPKPRHRFGEAAPSALGQHGAAGAQLTEMADEPSVAIVTASAYPVRYCQSLLQADEPRRQFCRCRAALGIVSTSDGNRHECGYEYPVFAIRLRAVLYGERDCGESRGRTFSAANRFAAVLFDTPLRVRHRYRSRPRRRSIRADGRRRAAEGDCRLGAVQQPILHGISSVGMAIDTSRYPAGGVDSKPVSVGWAVCEGMPHGPAVFDVADDVAGECVSTLVPTSECARSASHNRSGFVVMICA